MVSERTALLFLTDGCDLTVADICIRLDMPERTFYNYFPTKADALRPLLERGMQQIADTVRKAASSTPLIETMVLGFEASLWGEEGEYTRRIMPVIVGDPGLYRTWLSCIRDFESTLADAVRPSLHLDRGSLLEEMTAASLVSAVRIAFERIAEHNSKPAATFREALGMLSLPPTTT